MENFNEENFKQIIKYYKDKSSETELNFIILQINHMKSVEVLKKKHEDEINKLKNENELEKELHKNKMTIVDKEIIKLRSQLDKKYKKENPEKKENKKKTI